MFDSVYKLDLIGMMLGQHGEVSRSVWMVRHLQDMLRTNSLDKMDQSHRGLGGKGLPNGKGKMHVILFKYDIMVHLMERVLESLPISHETKEKIRAVFKSHQAYRAAFAYPNEAPKNKSWIGLLEGAGQAMLKVTADVVYGSKYDGILKLAVRGGQKPSRSLRGGRLGDSTRRGCQDCDGGVVHPRRR